MNTRRHFMSQSAAAASALAFPLVAGAQPKTIKVGVLHPVTGALAYSGQQCREGALMAIDDINKAGGIKSLGGAVDDHHGWGSLQLMLFEAVAAKHLLQPTFVTEYPEEVAPRARRPDRTAELRARVEDLRARKEMARVRSGARPPAGTAHGSLLQAAPTATCWYFSYYSGVPSLGLAIYGRERRLIFAVPTNADLRGLVGGFSDGGLPRGRAQAGEPGGAARGRRPRLAARPLHRRRLHHPLAQARLGHQRRPGNRLAEPGQRGPRRPRLRRLAEPRRRRPRHAPGTPGPARRVVFLLIRSPGVSR